MNTTLTAPLPPSSKPTNPQPSKSPSASTKSKSISSFNSKLNTELDEVTAAPETPPTQDSDPTSISLDSIPTEKTPLDLDQNHPDCPVQTLFPSQMNILIPPPIEEKTSSDKPSNGDFFLNTENKSTKASLLNPTNFLSNVQTSVNREQEQTIPSGTLDNTPIPASTPESSIQGLIASVKERPLAIENSTEISTPQPNIAPLESLKNETAPARPESISLSSQHRLETVLDSVFEEKPLPTPRRIEIKLQTPQGSQITLYIARVNQELRAQFSANNNQAFTWLQNEINQLKTLGSTESIRWLPAQIESGIPQSKSSGKSTQEKADQDDSRREGDSPLDSIFEFFKPSTRRLA